METSTRRVEPEEALSHVGRVLERVLTGYTERSAMVAQTA
jgi:hypothetical protein